MTAAAVNPRSRVLVIGGGYSGLRFGRAAAALGAQVWLTRRSDSPEPTASTSEPPLHWLPYDSSQGPPAAAPPSDLTHVLVTTPPAADGDAVIEHWLEPLRQQPLNWLGYLSTTGVYGDTDGGWVDETSPTTPGLARSRLRLESEQRWLGSGLPVQSFRLPAIYGPGRCPFNQLRQGSARLIHKPGQVFCRIHVDDIVGALLHCAARPMEHRPPVVNISDDTPCPSSETLGYAAHLLGCKLPPVQRFDAVAPSLSPMSLSFWADNRRVSNRLLCAELGYRLRYPSYREGFAASLREENASGLA
jgi:nucleoside-diphosphate-sugar epimerase